MAELGVSPGHSSPAARAWSCLTQARHRPVVWPDEIPDSGISHRNTGSSPCSGTEAGDSSPVFAALEHAAGDFTALGTDHSLECSSPPSDTQSGGTSPFSEHRLNTRTARLTPAASPRRLPGPLPAPDQQGADQAAAHPGADRRRRRDLAPALRRDHHRAGPGPGHRHPGQAPPGSACRRLTSEPAVKLAAGASPPRH